MFARLSDVTRQQRARIYVAALEQPTGTLALDAAVALARRIVPARHVAQLAADALRYSVACHGLHDGACAQIAITSLTRGIIPKPMSVIRAARRAARRERRNTSASLAMRLLLDDGFDFRGQL